MEKLPGLRIVGDASDELKEEARKNIENLLFNHTDSISEVDRKKLEALEYPKTEEQLAILKFVDEEINRLRVELGLEPYVLSPDNYHILPSELYKKAVEDEKGGSNATVFFDKQVVFMDASAVRGNDLNFSAVSLHESLHLKGHISLEVDELDEKPKVTVYRAGISARSTQQMTSKSGYHSHFDGLHEAIVSEQEKKMMPSLMEIPTLQKQAEYFKSKKAENLREDISNKKNIPIDDIVWVGENESQYETIPYRKPREVLLYVCREIQGSFPEDYKTTEEVFKEFLKAHFSGQLLVIAKLVEAVFGEGSFRLLGNMKPDKESAVLTLESLKRARNRNK